MTGEAMRIEKFSKIGILGMGRMSIGLAIDLALNGIQVDMIDLKSRPEQQRRQYNDNLKEECRTVAGLFERDLDSFPFPAYRSRLTDAEEYDLIFEGLPEEIPTKHSAFSRLAGGAVICSMTSTFTVHELTKGFDPPLNILVTHFMNPPYLIPFLEVVSHPNIDPALTDQLLDFLKATGHMPIRCKSSPGFVISRLQLCLMNEAVRLLEEGVASADDIDKAIKYGWGYRFPFMGILEFIDVGGLEILYHASRSVSQELNRPDLACPKLVAQRFHEGAMGTKTLRGIFEYESHEQIKKENQERQRKQVRLKLLLDEIHREGGARRKGEKS